MLNAILHIDQYLTGWPDAALTLALLAVVVCLVLIAWHGSPLLKAGALAWCVLP